MAQTRKDLRGRVLRKGESQRRSDGRYVYTYTDPLGRRKYVYAQDLVTLREKEAQLMKDQMDGLDIYVAGKATINFVFDRYMSLKNNLKPTTKSNYLYMYDRFIRETFGNGSKLSCMYVHKRIFRTIISILWMCNCSRIWYGMCACLFTRRNS